MTRYVIWAAPEIGYICYLARPPMTIYVIFPVHLFPLPPLRYNMLWTIATVGVQSDLLLVPSCCHLSPYGSIRPPNWDLRTEVPPLWIFQLIFQLVMLSKPAGYVDCPTERKCFAGNLKPNLPDHEMDQWLNHHGFRMVIPLRVVNQIDDGCKRDFWYRVPPLPKT